MFRNVVRQPPQAGVLPPRRLLVLAGLLSLAAIASRIENLLRLVRKASTVQGPWPPGTHRCAHRRLHRALIPADRLLSRGFWSDAGRRAPLIPLPRLSQVPPEPARKAGLCAFLPPRRRSSNDQPGHDPCVWNSQVPRRLRGHRSGINDERFVPTAPTRVAEEGEARRFGLHAIADSLWPFAIRLEQESTCPPFQDPF